ncbi:MAG: aminoglycoside phosphotransferase [Gammaproteobacteria bacterium]|nr:MAG: aminoglycoside phosphotransferase [Gammaproteobacteria bacterium]
MTTGRLEQIHAWLRNSPGMNSYTLAPASEDASFRRYFRIDAGAGTRILMDAPPGKEDCRPFLDINRRLAAAGVNVPAIHASDVDLGFILMDDFGSALYLDRLTEENADSLYTDAIDALTRMQRATDIRGLPWYDERLLLAEMRLFREWLVEKHLRISLNRDEETLLNRTFEALIANALEQPRTFVHRDYHSRNLMLTPCGNPGMLDYQDAVYGPISYDLVSLLKDCYIRWPGERIRAWVSDYCRKIEPAVDVEEERFPRWFDLMGAQRHLKASGIFARLWHRDGKAGFLRDIPRTLSYIVDLRDQYPELAGLADFIDARVLPALATPPGR